MEKAQAISSKIRIVNFSGLSVSSSNQFKVMVDNGDLFHCNRICNNVPLTLDNTQVSMDLHPTLSGADLVLGVQRLKTLGPTANRLFVANHEIIMQG